MACQILCRLCRSETQAGDIAELIDAHTDARGRPVCAACGATEAYVHRLTGLWEKEPEAVWNGYIKGVIRVVARDPMHAPYVFLTADSADGEISGICFSSFKDPGPAGRLADGPGPGGVPVLARGALFQLLERLSALGILTPRDIEMLGTRFRRDSPTYVFA